LVRTVAARLSNASGIPFAEGDLGRRPLEEKSVRKAREA